MKRIAIIGANGQVGSEVSLLLSMMPDVSVIPICRTQIGSAFLRKVGLPVRHGSPSEVEKMREILKDCDLVADFSLPGGAASEVRKMMREIIPNLTEAAPEGVPFVYLSSVTAFGVQDFHEKLRYYPFSRNIYGACKRYGEKLAHASAANTHRPSYVLRVGVVHGDLQMVTRKVQQEVRTSGGIPTSVPDCESYVVFAASIAQALVAIVNGKESPGTYTMLPNPGVKWKDLHEWYCRRVGVEPSIRLLGPEPKPNPVKAMVKGLVSPVKGLVVKNKDVIAGYLAALFPELENKLRTIYHLQGAEREVQQGLRAAEYRPYGNNHSVFPGKRLTHLSDPLEETDRYSERIYAAIRSAQAEPEKAESVAPLESASTAS